MIYRIKKASSYSGHEKPCDRARLRDDGWVITLSTIKQLDDLVDEVGPIILDDVGITVYDDYVE
jgi:hypothetical protein